MKRASNRTPKRQAKQFPWQRFSLDTPDIEKQYVDTLMIGLNSCQNIMELYRGLALWVLQVGSIEKQRHAARILTPDDVDFAKVFEN